MAREKEIKIKLKIPLESFLAKIKKQGFKLENTFKQTDIYFDTKDWYLYEHLAALRFRIVNDEEHSFSFKKMFYLPNKKDSYFIEEIEVEYPFNDIQKIKQIFEKLQIQGDHVFDSEKELVEILKSQEYFDEQRMLKTRQIFKNGDNEIMIDDVEGVGVVIELECQKLEPLDVINSLLNQDEWERELEGTSYAWLKKMKKLDSHIQNRKKFHERSDWNVWDHEKKMYAELIK